jgi:nucleoside-diphosphate-sugar epimerase
MQKILVLGSKGQIGNPLSIFLRSYGYQVDELDIEISEIHDLRHKTEFLVSLFKQADFVIFLAYDVGGSKYLAKYQHSKEFLDNNLKIMLTVFDLLSDIGNNFLFASSQMSNMTHSPYGTLKSIGEHYTKSLDGKIIKFWNVYGYETVVSKAHVVTDFIDSALIDGEIKMLTSGQESRQFLHVQDCSNAILALIRNYGALKSDLSYDITSFVDSTILEVANIVAEETGAKVTIGQSIDSVQKDAKNLPNSNILEMWSPMITLEDGIKQIINESMRNLEYRRALRSEEKSK